MDLDELEAEIGNGDKAILKVQRQLMDRGLSDEEKGQLKARMAELEQQGDEMREVFKEAQASSLTLEPDVVAAPEPEEEAATDSEGQQKHYLLFTSSYADGLEVKAKTDRIKMVLEARKLPFDEVDLYVDPEIRNDMEELSGDGQTLPQLFIDGDYLMDGLAELQYLHDNDLL